MLEQVLSNIKAAVVFCVSPLAAVHNGLILKCEDYAAIGVKTQDLHTVLLARAAIASATLQVARDRHSICHRPTRHMRLDLIL